MKVCVVGLGYVGLPTAIVLADAGFEVIGIDIDLELVKKINSGTIKIKEKELQELLKKVVQLNSLKAEQKMPEADVYIICVPTPFSRSDKEYSLRDVKNAANEIAKKLSKDSIVILESTVPPGTTNDVVKPILEAGGLKAGEDFYLAHCPERMLPGNALKELIENSRIIGGINSASSLKVKEIYERFVKGEISLTDATTAEFVKIIENTYGTVNIAFANELALIAEGLDIDINEAINLSNKHPRVNIFKPGPGVGGHCIPVDPWFLVEKAPSKTNLIKTALEINARMPVHVITLLASAFEEANKNIKDSKVVILGVAYKANVNDTRESPAIPVIEGLIQKGAKVEVYDPCVDKFKYEIKSDLYEAAKGADALIIITDHKEFYTIELEKLKQLMNPRPILVDTRNVLDSVEARKSFIFRGIGKPT